MNCNKFSNMLKNLQKTRFTAGRLAVPEVRYGSIRFFGGRTLNSDRINLLPDKAPWDLGIKLFIAVPRDW